MDFKRTQYAKHFAMIVDTIDARDARAIRDFLHFDDPMTEFCVERYGRGADIFCTSCSFDVREDGLWCWDSDDRSLFFAFKQEVPLHEVIEFKMLFG